MSTPTTPTTPVVEQVPVWDADSHVSEPPDLWTSRVPSRFGDLVPHIERSDWFGDHWVVGDAHLFRVGQFAMAGWREFIPGCPPTLDEADPGAWQPAPRLQRMDEYGVTAQVLYPNMIGFFIGAFVDLDEPELMLACVQAQNDFMAEFADQDPARLIPLMVLPYWDIDASLREMERCIGLGHRGVVAAGRFDGAGMPPLRDPHWDPLWAAAQERGLSLNFHIGFNADSDPLVRGDKILTRAGFSEATTLGFMANARTLAELLCSGVLHRFPDLKVVSVESGAGWLPFFLESLDWQWVNNGAHEHNPDWDLPSAYFHRQVYATYWFERESLAATLESLQDNLMFSTDFPHPTSQSPGPASFAVNPRDYVEATHAGLPDALARKVLHDNAQRVYTIS